MTCDITYLKMNYDDDYLEIINAINAGLHEYELGLFIGEEEDKDYTIELRKLDPEEQNEGPVVY